MAHEAPGKLRWQQGRPCDSGHCVEVAAAGEDVLVRSTLAPQVLLTLSRAEWREFLAGAKDGTFDVL
ncbi:MAG TPA: DUF397 domain-containing protein [Trebonia sp.]|nr:DUF397 domain-containing protein [Trebonia sp.]